MMTAYAAPPPRIDIGDSVNPLQRVIADAMQRAGIPLEARGSKAELARRVAAALGGPREDATQRARTSATIVTYIFNRPAYLPDETHRVAIAKALGMSKADLDAAGAAIKGLRAYASGSDVLRSLDEVRAMIVLSRDEMSAAELRKAKRQLEKLADEVAARLRGE